MIGVIGGSGFIGSYLCDILSKNNINFKIVDLVCPQNYKANWVKCDITDINTLRHALSDVTHIVNLAAEHKDNVTPISAYYEVNVHGSENICKIAQELGIEQIIFTSSVAVYGFVQEETDELGACNPFNHYGISKLQAEKVYKEWQARHNNHSLLIIRPTVVFGIGNRGNVYNLFKQIAMDKFIMIGTGNNKKSIAYVENLSAFIFNSLNITKGTRVINYVNKPDYSMSELTTIIGTTLNKKTSKFKLPYFIAIILGYCFDLLSLLVKKKFSISSIRIKKFCSSSQFKSIYQDEVNSQTVINLNEAIEKTIKAEFR